jgi:O-antigen/teichoic acid export membrane protein
MFAASGAIADAYGNHRLGWPLRWMALAVLGEALFAFLGSVVTSLRRVSIGLWMVLIESAAETFTAIALVVAGAGAAGAMLGKAIGYAVAVGGGLYLVLRLLGGTGRGEAAPAQVGLRRVVTYAGALFIVDTAWSAITQIDILMVGALLTSAAVGSFGAVFRIMTVLGYLGLAVSSGVAPRMSLGGGSPDVRAFNEGIRYLIIVQGVVIAPLLVWTQPIAALVLGSGYHGTSGVIRVLTPYFVIGAPASLISLAVTYLGEARRRVPIMLATLVLGLASTYVLLKAIGLVGAAVADDIVQVVYVAAHTWICSRLITVEFRRLARSAVRTLLAAGAMALVMLAVGTAHLSPAEWVLGVCAGAAAYTAVLVGLRELTFAELRAIASRLLVIRARPASE